MNYRNLKQVEKPIIPATLAQNFSAGKSNPEAGADSESVAIPEIQKAPIKLADFDTELRDVDLVDKDEETDTMEFGGTPSGADETVQISAASAFSEATMKPENVFVQKYDADWVGNSLVKVPEMKFAQLRKEKIEPAQLSVSRSTVEPEQLLATKRAGERKLGGSSDDGSAGLDSGISLELIDPNSLLQPDEIGIVVEDPNELLLVSLQHSSLSHSTTSFFFDQTVSKPDGHLCRCERN